MKRSLAHISDLHIGRSTAYAAASAELSDSLIRSGAEHVIVTGDITDHGRAEEYQEFLRIFDPLISQGRLSVLPGNHDRLGDEIARQIMDEGRVDVIQRDGLYMIRVDSTGPHNRRLFSGHGIIDQAVLDQVDGFLDQAPQEDLVVLALHHHLHPLPEEYWSERFSAWLGLPYASELHLGMTLLDRLQDRCDIVLHGHRHVPMERKQRKTKDLRIFNAGSSSELKRYRLFSHEYGSLVDDPAWRSTMDD